MCEGGVSAPNPHVVERSTIQPKGRKAGNVAKGSWAARDVLSEKGLPEFDDLEADHGQRFKWHQFTWELVPGNTYQGVGM